MEHLRYHKIIDHLILEELLNGKEVALRVWGKSMYPLMRQGDSIRLEKCTVGTLAIGDIITFKKDCRYFTHRMLWRTKKANGIMLVTKGDNEINPDPPVSPDHILGRVVAIRRAHRTLHLEAPTWRFMNRVLGSLFLLETAFILLYRFSAGRLHPFRTFLAKSKPSQLYHHLKCKGLLFATRIII